LAGFEKDSLARSRLVIRRQKSEGAADEGIEIKQQKPGTGVPRGFLFGLIGQVFLCALISRRAGNVVLTHIEVLFQARFQLTSLSQQNLCRGESGFGSPEHKYLSKEHRHV
jgi:hypothetical protein